MVTAPKTNSQDPAPSHFATTQATWLISVLRSVRSKGHWTIDAKRFAAIQATCVPTIGTHGLMESVLVSGNIAEIDGVTRLVAVTG